MAGELTGRLESLLQRAIAIVDDPLWGQENDDFVQLDEQIRQARNAIADLDDLLTTLQIKTNTTKVAQIVDTRRAHLRELRAGLANLIKLLQPSTQ